jgi:hypothetical protein
MSTHLAVVVFAAVIVREGGRSSIPESAEFMLRSF